MPSVSNAFLARSLHYLRNDYRPKILRCLDRLSEEDIWWRPHFQMNSIGNLVLHLCGNARQWIISGVGGAPDVRKRQEEFDERGPVPTADLRLTLESTIEDATVTLQTVDQAALLEFRSIQGNRVTVLDAIYHVVEHFSTHTGQIIYITKLRTGDDLGFYRITDEGEAFPTWT